jgi:hypothetical protein
MENPLVGEATLAEAAIVYLLLSFAGQNVIALPMSSVDTCEKERIRMAKQMGSKLRSVVWGHCVESGLDVSDIRRFAPRSP